MLFASGYVLIVQAVFKPGCMYTFRSDLFFKNEMLSSGWHDFEEVGSVLFGKMFFGTRAYCKYFENVEKN